VATEPVIAATVPQAPPAIVVSADRPPQPGPGRGGDDAAPRLPAWLPAAAATEKGVRLSTDTLLQANPLLAAIRTPGERDWSRRLGDWREELRQWLFDEFAGAFMHHGESEIPDAAASARDRDMGWLVADEDMRTGSSMIQWRE
jgi:hypothetical protein